MPPAADPSPPGAARDDALAVLLRLREQGHVSYFAGGCVRDELLGTHPKDYDVATDAPPPRVRQMFPRTQAVGAAFGVILVRHGRSVIEVATFRTDGTYRDGRRPEEVTFSSPEADAQRRDFTVNGLFLDPVENRVIDYVGGQADLKACLIRAIGNPDERFAEDHLRLLRAVRFAARMGFTIEPQTAAAIRRHAHQLPRISPERIAEELRKMLTPPTRPAACAMLDELGLLAQVLRFLGGTGGCSLLEAVAPGETIGFGTALAALALAALALAGTGWERARLLAGVQACRKALRISNDEAEQMTACMELKPLLDAPEPSVATMKRFLAKPYARDAQQILAALGRTTPALAARVGWLQQRFAEFLKSDFAPPPLLTGDDLTAAGATPGPAFKRVLDAVYDAQLEDRVTNREVALQMGLALLRPAGGSRPD